MFKYNLDISFESHTIHGMLASHISRGECVLEFGCAKGLFSKHLKEELGCKVYGIEISQHALEVAKAHLDGYICCDIENYDWESELSGIKFDTLVFADVLEHLREPAKAIKRALSLLKDDGKIIFSVPNIAHADIILKLLGNRFDYTDIGLLDNTHIHLFAKENIAELCADAGIFPVIINGTIAPLGETEQGTEHRSAFFENAVLSKDDALVYHYFCLAYKSEYAKANALETKFDLKNPRNEIKLYFDTGSGLSENERLSYYMPDGDIEITASLPKGIKHLRLDLREDAGYAISGFEFLIDGKPLSPVALNGVVRVDSLYLFTEHDPSFLFVIDDGAKEVAIKATIQSYFALDNHMELPIGLWNALADARTMLDTVKGELDVTRSELDGARVQIASLESTIVSNTEEINSLNTKRELLEGSLFTAQKQIASLDAQLQYFKQELETYKSHYVAAIFQRDELQRHCDNLQMQYNIIANAGWWKITKPFRVLFDIIKYPFRHGPILKVRKFFKVWREQGFKAACKKVARKRAEAKKGLTPLYTPAELEAQRNVKFERDIKFSILVPLYNTPERFLREMIDSVIAQTYSNWELCLADGSDSEHGDVEEIVMKYAKKDNRIVYKRLEKNLGISENTNACIDMSSGNFIALFDHDDILHPAALYNMMVEICENNADFVYTDEATFESPDINKIITIHHKPDFAIDNLRANNYICHFSAFSREVLDKAGRFRHEFDGSQDHDLILRLTENAKNVVHIPKVLYWWRSHPMSVAMDINSKTYAIDAGKRAVAESIKRAGYDAVVESSRAFPTIYRIKYALKAEPKVSIIIPNKNHYSDLRTCINSILGLSTYKNYEIVIVDNGSDDKETLDYYKTLEASHSVKICYLDIEFNYSKLNNFASKHASGDYYILLNNDIEIITPEWIEEMLMYAQRDDVGAVGAMLYYPDNTIQHAGVIMRLGAQRIAGHAFHKSHRVDVGYMGRLCYSQNMSAVTAACMMVKKSVFDEINGFDEDLAVAYNDIDLCARIRQAGYLIVWTPYAEAYHYESKSRGYEDASPEKRARFEKEVAYFKEKWADLLEKSDPYYNPNFTLDSADFALL